MTTADEVIYVAASQIGTTEDPPGSNSSLYGNWYGINPAPWCAMFVSWCFAQVNGSSLVAAQSDKGYAACGFGRNWFRDNGWLVSDPQKGDVVFFEWESDDWPDHTGIVESVNDNGSVNTIEGNASGPDHTDEVARHSRNRTVAKWFGRPQYDGVVAPVATTAPEPQGTVLQYKSSGPAVAALQGCLNFWGWNAGSADGLFGPQTEVAVKRAQAVIGVSADGIWGPDSQAAYDRFVANMQAFSQASAPTNHSVVQLNSSGAEVQELQNKLNRLIGSNLSEDGRFGPATDAAVKSFQRFFALNVDGIVGPQSWTTLDDCLAKTGR